MLRIPVGVGDPIRLIPKRIAGQTADSTSHDPTAGTSTSRPPTRTSSASPCTSSGRAACTRRTGRRTRRTGTQCGFFAGAPSIFASSSCSSRPRHRAQRRAELDAGRRAPVGVARGTALALDLLLGALGRLLHHPLRALGLLVTCRRERVHQQGRSPAAVGGGRRGAGWRAALRTAARGVLLRIAAALLRERPAVAKLRRRLRQVDGRVVAKQGLRAAIGIHRRRRHGVGPGGRRGRRGEGDEREELQHHCFGLRPGSRGLGMGGRASPGEPRRVHRTTRPRRRPAPWK